ncbi:MAG TPA: ATP-binding protein, partial [Candidatus Margulisiibacteriota bacterium]|nr:ATP-binding protein [Candidatus Margulisiibacteriota bacterium]
MEENNQKNSYAQLVTGLISAIRKAAFYPAKHPAVVSAVEELFRELSLILKTKDSLTLDIAPDNKILVEGEPVGENTALIEQSVFYFKKAKIDNLTFISGLIQDELERLIEVILNDPKQARTGSGLKKVLAENNIEHIQTNQFSYIKVDKEKEALIDKVDKSELDEIKSKVMGLVSGKIAKEETEAIGGEVFAVVIRELKKEKAVSNATRGLLKKFLSSYAGEETGIARLKTALMSSGCPAEKADSLLKKLETDSGKTKEARPSLAQENEELRSRIRELQEELEKKSREAEEIEKRARSVLDDKERIDNVVHNMSDGLVVVDPMGKILMVNPAAEGLLGVSTQDIGRQLKEVVKDEHLLAMVKNAPSAKDGVIEKDVELFTPNESTMKVLRASSALVEDQNGKTVGMVAILNDITKQKELERLKSDFVANVSHEIRTPLIAVEKSLELILSKSTGPLSADQDKFLSIAERNLERLNLLINDLLDLSKLEAGKVSLLCEPSSLPKIIDESVVVFSNWAESKGLRIEKVIPANLPQVNLDSNRITQVVSNLLSNAVKFTPANGTITVGAGLNGTGEVEVSVKDTGIGIPEDEIPRLFSKFYQVRGNLKTDVRGTGIGLAIAKEIVELHGGKMWVESAVNKGTQFIFTLPC